MTNLVDPTGAPITPETLEPPKPWDFSIYDKRWEPDMSLSYPMYDMEVVSLVNIYTSKYAEINGDLSDVAGVEALVEEGLERYGARMTEGHKNYFRMAMSQTLFQVGIQFMIAAQRRESSISEDVRRRMAKELIDQIDRPDRRRNRKNGN